MEYELSCFFNYVARLLPCNLVYNLYKILFQIMQCQSYFSTGHRLSIYSNLCKNTRKWKQKVVIDLFYTCK